ncbi:MAG: bifunctional phosphatase PAP2/diacylglycerol kinase family protein [Sporichthyaceae bacterium]
MPRTISPWIESLDHSLFARVQAKPSPVLDAVLPRLSRAANHGLLWAGTAAAIAAAGGKGNRRAALRGMASLALASASVNGPAKLVFRRDRPDAELVLAVRQLTRRPTSWSFPSGHSASAAAFATGVALERPLLGAGVGVVASGVAWSRVHTGVHYPSDVLAGIAMGAAATWLLTKVWPLRPPPAGQLGRGEEVELPKLDDGAGLHLVINPSSGPNGSGDFAERFADAWPAATVQTLAEGEDLLEALTKAAAHAAVLGISGGDGSVNAAAQVASAAGLPLLVVPGGTLNHFAAELGLHGVDEVLAAGRAGTGEAVDVAAIVPSDGGEPQVFLNAASVGVYPELVAAREELEDRIGKWPALLVALVRVLRTYDPIEVDVDGEKRRTWMLFLGNCVFSPQGFAPTYRTRLDDGLIDVRLVDAGHPYSRTRLVVAFALGRLHRSPVLTGWHADEVRVTARTQEMPPARDGEVGAPLREFTVRKIGSLPVYRPAAD